MILLTVGHSTRTADAFVGLLRAHGVDLVVDVRRFPGSRRHPQFGSTTLAAALAEAGIDYRHEEVLGGRRSRSGPSPNDGWRSASFRAYADHLLTPEAALALDRLEQDARARTPAIMCAEAVPWHCHRQILADHMVARGLTVAHILGEERAELHTLNTMARVLAGGRVIYPGAQAEQVPLL